MWAPFCLHAIFRNLIISTNVFENQKYVDFLHVGQDRLVKAEGKLDYLPQIFRVNLNFTLLLGLKSVSVGFFD